MMVSLCRKLSGLSYTLYKPSTHYDMEAALLILTVIISCICYSDKRLGKLIFSRFLWQFSQYSHRYSTFHEKNYKPLFWINVCKDKPFKQFI